MLTWKFLHVATMFAALAMLFAPDVYLFRAAGKRDVIALRKISALSDAVVNTGVVLFFTGIGFGVAAAIAGEIDLTARWLITAYVLVAVSVIVGGGIENRYLKQIAAAADASPDDPSPQLEALLRSPRRHLTWVAVALDLAIIYVMIAKPFS